MKLRERRTFQVINKIRENLLDSDKAIGVVIDPTMFKGIENEFSHEEVSYTLRFLDGKGYLIKTENGQDYYLTAKGYEEWLFPDGPISEKRIFISYAVKDKVLAGNLKQELEKIGLTVFLAHDDIEPTAKWRDKIISELKSSSTFIALRTKNYLGRPYTEQECGFALALNKRILTLCVDTGSKDMGFCSEFQGENFKIGEEEKIFGFCKKQLVL